jgi:hypothetical protein
MLLGVLLLRGHPAAMIVDPGYVSGVVVVLHHLVELPDLAVWVLVGVVLDRTRGLVDLQEPVRLQECTGDERAVGVNPELTIGERRRGKPVTTGVNSPPLVFLEHLAVLPGYPET